MVEMQTPQPADEGPVVFTVPWSEHRKQFKGQVENEALIGQTWDMNEELVFFFLMWLGTY